MKKTLWVLLILTLLCLLALSACDNTDIPSDSDNDNSQQTTLETDDDGEQDDHSSDTLPEETAVCQHVFSEWNTVKTATCKEEGKRIRTCGTCSEVEEEIIPKTDDHTVVTDAAVAATCKNTGLTEGSHCSVCNKVIAEQTVVPQSDHTVVTDAAVAATCKNTGLTEGSHCSFCGKVLTVQKQIPKLDHTFVDGECSCGEKSGLSMKLSDDGTYYIVSGIGTYAGTVITIPDTYKGRPVKAVGESAFNGNEKITHVVMGSEITEIQPWSFYQCTALTGVTVSSIDHWCKIKFLDSYANPLFYAKKLYVGDSLVTDVVIPDDVESVNMFSFANCTSIQTVQLGRNVKRIERSAFHSCPELVDIKLNGKLEAVERYAFFGCRKLATDLHFADTLVEIGDYAFANGHGLSGAYFGSSLRSIGSGAFQNCGRLKALTIPATAEFIGKYAFQNCSGIDGVIFQAPSGWKCSHASYPMSKIGEAALSYAVGAADMLTDLYTDCDWMRGN